MVDGGKWLSVRISRTDHGRVTRIQDAFEVVFTGRGFPANAAMYQRREDTLTHAVLYFSPGAADIFAPELEDLNAVLCEQPESDEVSLLVGHAHATDTSFPVNAGAI